MAAVIGYLRVSTVAQAESGLGLEAQEAAVREAAGRLSLPVTALYTDAGLSGTLPLAERPALLDALADLTTGDVLLVARRDRIGRDVVVVAVIEREIGRRGARLVSAAGEASDLEGPSGALVRTILDAVNQFERATIALRTRAALRALRARGDRAGAIPFGRRLASDGHRLEPDPDEAVGLALIREGCARGASLHAIARDLETAGVRPKRGVRWYASSVRSIARTAGLRQQAGAS